MGLDVITKGIIAMIMVMNSGSNENGNRLIKDCRNVIGEQVMMKVTVYHRLLCQSFGQTGGG